jgi:hypothetical protein
VGSFPIPTKLAVVLAEVKDPAGDSVQPARTGSLEATASSAMSHNSNELDFVTCSFLSLPF